MTKRLDRLYAEIETLAARHHEQAASWDIEARHSQSDAILEDMLRALAVHIGAEAICTAVNMVIAERGEMEMWFS